MIIRKIYNKRLKRNCWGYEGRFAGKRRQDFSFATKAEAEAAAWEERRRARRIKRGLPAQDDGVSQLIETLIAQIPDTPQNAAKIEMLGSLLSAVTNHGASISKRQSPTFEQLIEKRLPTIANQQERTRARRVLTTLLGLLPVGVKVEQIETEHLRRFVERRQSDGQSPASIDRELNIISATLNVAQDFFSGLRHWRPPKIPRPKVPKTRRERIITDEEYRLILDYLQRPRAKREKHLAYLGRTRAAQLLRFALLTGMRPKEIFLLKWSDLDRDGNRIKVVGTKTENRGNSTRYIPLTESIREVLKAREWAGESLEFVFSISGTPRYTDYDLLREACETNGIPYGRSVENGFELYCARHTFTTRLLQSGLSLAEVGAVTGHSDRELVLYYSHITPETAARTIDRIEAIEAKRRNHSGLKTDSAKANSANS